MISIVVPIYNAETYLRTCLQSIRLQSYDDFEVLMVDDGSTDNSSLICKEFSSEDSRFAYYYKSNSGVSSTRNYGIEKAHGEFIVFVDADDYVDCDYLQSMIKLWDTSHAHIIVQGVKQLTIDGNVTVEGFPDAVCNAVAMDQHLFYCLVMYRGPYCKLFKLEIINKYNIQFPTNISFGEDALFIYQYLLHCQKIAFSSKSEYNYIVKNGGSLSTKIHHPEKMYFFLKERTRLIHRLQELYKQDDYKFPMLAERNLMGLKTVIYSMKCMKFSPKECQNLISEIKNDGFFHEVKAKKWQDILFIVLLWMNKQISNQMLLKFI